MTQEKKPKPQSSPLRNRWQEGRRALSLCPGSLQAWPTHWALYSGRNSGNKTPITTPMQLGAQGFVSGVGREDGAQAAAALGGPGAGLSQEPEARDAQGHINPGLLLLTGGSRHLAWGVEGQVRLDPWL